jgi:Family of unknown function (DUF6171)
VPTASAAMIVRFPIKQLREIAKSRPAGYLEDVIKSGRIDNGTVFLDEKAYLALRQKYAKPTKFPPMMEMAKNAVLAAARTSKQIASGKRVMVSGEEQARRLAICKACEFFTGSRCLKCGCVIRWKSRLATEHCPIQKW